MSTSIELTIFDGTETLLIGAPLTKEQTISVNPGCKFSVGKARENLRDMDRLSDLGTSRPHMYNDGAEFQL